MLPSGCSIIREKEETLDVFPSVITLAVFTCLMQTKNWRAAKKTCCILSFAGFMDLSGKNWLHCAVLVYVCIPVPQTFPITSSMWGGRGRLIFPFGIESASISSYSLPMGKLRYKACKQHTQKLCNQPSFP